MKAGDRFTSFKDLLNAMQQCWGVKFSLFGAFIPNLPQHPDVCCAKHVFYNKDFLSGITIPWNEFEGISKAKTQTYWNDDQWIVSPDTSIVHEIRNPEEHFYDFENHCDFPTPGGHPPYVIKYEPVKRLIIGKFKTGYVFLGLYELDQAMSLSYCNTNAYEADGVSFPYNPAMGFSKPLISYPHCVWKRIADGLNNNSRSKNEK